MERSFHRAVALCGACSTLTGLLSGWCPIRALLLRCGWMVPAYCPRLPLLKERLKNCSQLIRTCQAEVIRIGIIDRPVAEEVAFGRAAKTLVWLNLSQVMIARQAIQISEYPHRRGVKCSSRYAECLLNSALLSKPSQLGRNILAEGWNGID